MTPYRKKLPLALPVKVVNRFKHIPENNKKTIKNVFEAVIDKSFISDTKCRKFSITRILKFAKFTFITKKPQKMFLINFCF